MASVSCFFSSDAVGWKSTGCWKDADAFQIEMVPALYSPGLTMATDTGLGGTGKGRCIITKLRILRNFHSGGHHHHNRHNQHHYAQKRRRRKEGVVLHCLKGESSDVTSQVTDHSIM